jgi:hypothetical protein
VLETVTRTEVIVRSRFPNPNENTNMPCIIKIEIPVSERRDNLHARKESNMGDETIELGSWFYKLCIFLVEKWEGDKDQ